MRKACLTRFIPCSGRCTVRLTVCGNIVCVRVRTLASVYSVSREKMMAERDRNVRRHGHGAAYGLRADRHEIRRRRACLRRRPVRWFGHDKSPSVASLHAFTHHEAYARGYGLPVRGVEVDVPPLGGAGPPRAACDRRDAPRRPAVGVGETMSEASNGTACREGHS